MTKEITVRNQVVIIDDEDYEMISKYKWTIDKPTGKYAKKYVKSHVYKNGKHYHVFMHKILIDSPSGYEIDHINGNTLDNRKSNLRICKTSENQMNRGPQKNNTSGYKGVTRRGNRWVAKIQNLGKWISCGSHETPEEAAKAYNKKAKELNGDFAWLNKV